MKLDSKVPSGPIADKWDKHKFDVKLVNPANKRKFTVIIVGTGLAGASAAASLAELGYNVLAFTFHDSPRRAHSIAAQGGINAAKNYRNDGDSVYRLFYDTIKGGDYRAREANVYRLAQISVDIIDQCVAQGVPFAREYGGLLDNRSFGGAQVSRTFYARGQTGQQLLLGAYQQMMRQVDAGAVKLFPRREMLDLVTVDGQARGITVRNLLTGEIESYSADAVLLCTGGYGNAYYLSTNALNSNVTAAWRAHRKGALFANPCYTQIHPTCIPVTGTHQSKLTLMSESLRNDGRVWVSKPRVTSGRRDRFPKKSATTFWSVSIRPMATWHRATFHRAPQKKPVMTDAAWAPADWRCISTLRKRFSAWAKTPFARRYGNLFHMYQKITDENPYQVPMRIYPAIHYTMGGLWVDYNLMSNVPGLYVLGEANFSDHGANRLGASALMQGLADGYFIIPYTIGDYLAGTQRSKVTTDHDAFKQSQNDVQQRISRLLSLNGSRTVTDFHRTLGNILWDKVGMARNEAGLNQAIGEIRQLREEFWQDVKLVGSADNVNQELEHAGRVADYLEFGELLAQDALHRNESCGGHFREEHQTPEGEALRDDENYTYVAAWEYAGDNVPETLHKETLEWEEVHPTQRSYK
jgi:succinate dehydrogenase / fumarate reductase flavoprotein subunit